jgi:hypothetical protein
VGALSQNRHERSQTRAPFLDTLASGRRPGEPLVGAVERERGGSDGSGTVLAPRGRLIGCGYGSPRSGLRPDPVGTILRELGSVPVLELSAVAPEGGPIAELAVLRAG